jgi:antitoxin FitA
MRRRYIADMPVSMTIRDVPDHTRDVLAARASRAGMSLQEYLRAELNALADRPSPDEFWERVRHRVRATGTRLPADVVLEARDSDRR